MEKNNISLQLNHTEQFQLIILLRRIVNDKTGNFQEFHITPERKKLAEKILQQIDKF